MRQHIARKGETMNDGTRRAFQAETQRVTAIEDTIKEACPGLKIEFQAARKNELARVKISEPSALFLLRERRRNAGARP